MDYLPIFADVRNKLCLVVGGGAVGKRKAGVLLEAGANVRVVAPQIEPELAEQEGIECDRSAIRCAASRRCHAGHCGDQ